MDSEKVKSIANIHGATFFEQTGPDTYIVIYAKRDEETGGLTSWTVEHWYIVLGQIRCYPYVNLDDFSMRNLVDDLRAADGRYAARQQ